MLADLLKTPAKLAWEKIGIQHTHGIVVPLFALRSQHSCGIGEFFDLLPLLPWCHELGLKVIQLLPLNDTGKESSPYSALSAFALNPIHLSLSKLPFLTNEFDQKIKDLQSLSNSQFIDYPLLYSKRTSFLHDYYYTFKDKLKSINGLKAFIQANDFWLAPYSRFKAMKEATDWQPWQSWGEAQFISEDITLIHQIIQFLCFQQLQEVKKLANGHGIFIKGDIPILINKESADVWHNQELFNLRLTAGAPPDMYSSDGQNWMFPIYNWDALEKTNYRWWKKRLEVAKDLYDLYRLDHVVGFYRIWSIPMGLTGKEGYFVPNDPASWIPHGNKIMKIMLETTNMLPIAEDLGTVPNEVKEDLKKLGICGTKVMRWERRWNSDRGYIEYENYPFESMTTVSTHDSETLVLWWKNNPDEARLWATWKEQPYAPELSQNNLFTLLFESHRTPSLFHINLLQEYLALVPGLTWDDPEDERINLPGTISSRNWSYRFRPYIEKIIENQELKQWMKQLIP